MKYLLFAALLCFAASCKKSNSLLPAAVQTKIPDAGAALIPVNRLTIDGDFNGDGTTETLIQDIADSTGTAVKYMPQEPAEIANDTTNEGWNKYLEFYSSLNYRTRLRTENLKSDDLYFSNCQGLYCLINVGNLNNSKGDEIALVIDRLDQSRDNDCKIFTLCNGVWQQVFMFSVHEDAFDFVGNTPPVLTSIPKALEYSNNEWRYYDYLEMEYETLEEVGQMKKLVVGKCVY